MLKLISESNKKIKIEASLNRLCVDRSKNQADHEMDNRAPKEERA